MVEVAPAELAAKRLRALAARQALLDRRGPRASRSAGTARAARSGRRRARRAPRCSRAIGPSRKRSSVRRAAASPPGAGSATSCESPSDASDGSRPLASFEGSAGSSRGALEHGRGAGSRATCGETARRRCTACPGRSRSRARRSRSAPRASAARSRPPRTPRRTRSPRRRANGLTSWVTWTVARPSSPASSTSSRSGGPWRTTSPEPRSRSSRIELGAGTRAGTGSAARTRGGRAAAGRRSRTPGRPARGRRAPRAGRGGRGAAGRDETRRCPRSRQRPRAEPTRPAAAQTAMRAIRTTSFAGASIAPSRRKSSAIAVCSQ